MSDHDAMPGPSAAKLDAPASPLLPPQRWQDKAACLDVDDVNWFAVQVSRGDNAAWHDNLRRAREVCAVCPVRSDCMADALDHDAVGIWAGTTEKERPVRPKPIRHGTAAGYRMHHRRGEEACFDCRLGNALAQQDKRNGYRQDRRNGAA